MIKRESGEKPEQSRCCKHLSSSWGRAGKHSKVTDIFSGRPLAMGHTSLYIGQDADFMEYLRKARSDVKTRCKSEDLPLSSLHLLDEA